MGLNRPSSPGLLLAICYLGFVSLGLPDTLLGVAWPSIREHFGLRQGAIVWIFFGAGCSYFLSSFFAGRLLRKINVGVLLAGSSALVALSGLDYAMAPAWALFAAGSLLHGLGSGAIDSGLNHYVACHFSARHMNWLHASYSLGAMLGPLLMTAMITHARSWRGGYLIVAFVLAGLSSLFLGTRRRWDEGGTASEHASRESQPPAVPLSALAVLQHPVVWLQIFLFFVYTGLEVAVGQWSFTVLTEARHIDPELAGYWVTLYWTSILAGRVLFGFLVDGIRIDALIRGSTLAALAGTALFVWSPFPLLDPCALALSGLGLAVIFPCLMTRTPQRFGAAMAQHAIGFQVGAAMLGAAALPSAVGFIAQSAGLRFIPSALLAMSGALVLLHELVLWFSDSRPRDPVRSAS